jgi:hypothetical protein
MFCKNICTRVFAKGKGTLNESEWFYEGEMIQKFGKSHWKQHRRAGTFECRELEDTHRHI